MSDFIGDHVEYLEARIRELEAERDALRGEGANRYWEGRFRDEKARADKAEVELHKRMIDALAPEPAEKETIESLTVERCKKAIISIMYGSPSGRKGKNQPGWPLHEDCTPRDASMHDNGCIDAIKAIRALALAPEPAKTEP